MKREGRRQGEEEKRDRDQEGGERYISNKD